MVRSLALQVYTQEALPADWATTQNNLGVTYTDRVRGDRANNFEQAIACFQAALQVRTREAFPNQWAMTQNGLGYAYFERVRGDRTKNLEQSICCYQAALQVCTREALPAQWAMTQHSLGAAYWERVQGNRAENLEVAIGCFQAALQVYQSDTRPNESRKTARNLGQVCSHVGRWREAGAAYGIALDAAEVMYQASLSVSSRQVELTDSVGVAVGAAYALAKTGQAGDAVVVLERGRARELGDALDRDRADLADVARRDPEVYESYRRASERLRTIEAAERRSGTAAEGMLAEEARGAVAELAVAVEGIRRISGFEGFLVQPDLDKVASAVEASTPLAYLLCTQAGSLTLLAHRAEGTSLAVEAIWAEDFTASDQRAFLFTSDGDEVTGGYLPGQLGNQDWLEDALAHGLPLLGERLVRPLASRLAELRATGVVLVPCGLLGLLPLHAVDYRRAEHQRCLLDEFDVSYAPSARVLTTARNKLRTRRETRSPVLAGVGNPLPHPNPLTFAQVELEEVAACFDQARPLYEEAATKQALVDAAVGATHVHLSCHGQYDLDEPLASELMLADQQQLSLGEVLADQPFVDARLVVASACQTAIIDFKRLPDEAIGLPAGFLSAGTPGVVGTLWPVNDLSTTLLMAQFYRYHLHGDLTTGEAPMPPVRALRRAQRWLARVSAGELYEHFRVHSVARAVPDEITTVRTPEAVAAMATARFGLEDAHARPFASPYHWAPFIFVGA